MSVDIVSRSAWGARPWTNDVATVPLSERTEFYIHYDGGTPVSRTGVAVPQAIEREHLGNGWSGIGYHFVVDQAGTVYEGRGWNLQGAHCPNHNRSAIGVQIAVGGDQAPSDAALRSARALYDMACARTGRQLAMRGHRDGFATSCPGTRLYAWVKAGMPAPGGGSTGGGAATPYPGYLIRRGSTGGAVRVVQSVLTRRGYSVGRFGADGVFGGDTEAAVRRFQSDQRISSDGVVGPVTWSRLMP
ncbi:N-acetylmuramoyl-L-alanine amidase [Kitasatospora sp. NPDC002040]|uniref:peptidoglycan recognition protein family protein n=1 Tax=Kitasatospora sp. NPDC002040 TaxID=3154661 RepID=UPI003323727E